MSIEPVSLPKARALRFSSGLEAKYKPDLLLNHRIQGTRASDHLNVIRGLAAVFVVCFHLRGTFFIDRTPGSGAALWLFYFLMSLGNEAVMVFFVLSGFLIGANVLRAVFDQRWEWLPYLVSRSTRLYIVLVPALGLGALWDFSGITLTGPAGIYGGLIPNASISSSVLPSLRWPVFLGNLLFLQTIVVGTFGSNGPLWSLSNEFWYYIMFPLGALALSPSSNGGRRWICILALPLIALFVGYSIARLFSVWLLGVGINLLPKLKTPNVRVLLVPVLGLLFIVLALSYLHLGIMHHALISSLCVGFAAGLLIYLLLHSEEPSAAGIYARLGKTVAGFSYTLYLVHLPLMVFIKAAVLPQSRWSVDFPALMAGCVILAVLLIYAWMISELTEARTDSLRSRVLLVLARFGFVRAAA